MKHLVNIANLEPNSKLLLFKGSIYGLLIFTDTKRRHTHTSLLCCNLGVFLIFRWNQLFCWITSFETNRGVLTWCCFVNFELNFLQWIICYYVRVFAKFVKSVTDIRQIGGQRRGRVTITTCWLCSTIYHLQHEISSTNCKVAFYNHEAHMPEIRLNLANLACISLHNMCPSKNVSSVVFVNTDSTLGWTGIEYRLLV